MGDDSELENNTGLAICSTLFLQAWLVLAVPGYNIPSALFANPAVGQHVPHLDWTSVLRRSVTAVDSPMIRMHASPKAGSKSG